MRLVAFVFYYLLCSQHCALVLSLFGYVVFVVRRRWRRWLLFLAQRPPTGDLRREFGCGVPFGYYCGCQLRCGSPTGARPPFDPRHGTGHVFGSPHVSCHRSCRWLTARVMPPVMSLAHRTCATGILLHSPCKSCAPPHQRWSASSATPAKQYENNTTCHLEQ